MALINAEARHLQAYDVDGQAAERAARAGQVVSAYDEALIARQALAMPAFMRYDSTLAARFEVKPRHVGDAGQPELPADQVPGRIGGKIGWTVKSEATYIGLARRNGVTLIVTILHCTPLQEITSAEQLLNWGFAMNGKVRPVGMLVSPLPPAAAIRKEQQASRRRGGHCPRHAAHHRALASRPSPASGHMLGLAVGVGAIAVLGLGGLARQRRRRPPRQLARRHRVRSVWMFRCPR